MTKREIEQKTDNSTQYNHRKIKTKQHEPHENLELI